MAKPHRPITWAQYSPGPGETIVLADPPIKVIATCSWTLGDRTFDVHGWAMAWTGEHVLIWFITQGEAVNLWVRSSDVRRP